MSGDGQHAHAARSGRIGLTPAQFSRNNTGCVDTNQYFSCTWMRLWRVFIDHLIRPATAMHTDRFHLVVSLLSFRPVGHDATKLAQMSLYIRFRAWLSVLF